MIAVSRAILESALDLQKQGKFHAAALAWERNYKILPKSAIATKRISQNNANSCRMMAKKSGKEVL